MAEKEEMKITYQYEHEGRTCRQCSSGHIWLDVGNSGEKGVFDHHHSRDGSHSTVDLLARDPGRLEDVLREAEALGSLTIHLHREPDLDAEGAVFLVHEFLRWGPDGFRERYNRENGRYRKLVDYINDIDAGKGKIVTKLTLYALSAGLPKVIEAEGDGREAECKRYNQVVGVMLKALERVTGMLEEDPDVDLHDSEIPDLDGDVPYRRMKERVEDIRPAYERDKEDNILVDKIEVNLFTKIKDPDGKVTGYGIKPVRAAIWSSLPTYEEEHVIAREDAVLTFVPHGNGNRRGVRVSINPDKPGYDQYTLEPFAEIMELMEQKCDRQILEQTGKLPRDYSKWRADGKAENRFARKPFSATADPWYFSEEGDMVDTPGKGTELQWDEMIRILMQHTHFIKKSYMVAFAAQEDGDEPVVEIRRMDSPISLWRKQCSEEFLKSDREYRFLITEIDAEMIAHSYDILDSYYAILTGASLMDQKNDSCLHFDYRTHLYCNMRCGVLFIATQEEGNKGKKGKTGDAEKADLNRPLLEGLLDLGDEAGVRGSRLVEIVLSLVRSRKQLTDISRFLGEVFRDGRKESGKNIKEQNRKLVRLNSLLRKESVIDSQIGHEIYQCIGKSFEIDDLRREVNEEMAAVCEYTSEKAFGTFEKLSILTVPFLVLGSFFQIGFLRIDPVCTVAEHPFILLGWGVFYGVVLVVTALLFLKKR